MKLLQTDVVPFFVVRILAKVPHKYNNPKATNTIPLGGSAGIGKEIAKFFNKDGATVAIVARTLEKLQAAKEDMPNPGRCIAVSGDIASSEGVTTAIEKAVGGLT